MRAQTPFNLVALVLLLCVPSGELFARTAFWVAPNGNDTSEGSEARPFASLEAARDAVRRLRSKESQAAGEVTVWIKGGTYFRDRTFTLATQDSGTVASPVTYRVASNQVARFLGGKTITTPKPVTDPAVLNRLPTEARARVVQVDLRAEGIQDFGKLRSRGFGRPMSPAHLELFYGGAPMTLARWPNEGEWAEIAGFPAESGQGDDHGGKIGKLESGFEYAGDRPSGWKVGDDIWVHGYWAWDWANSYERVESIDIGLRLVKTAAPHGLYGFRKGQRFYFLNVLEELDRPGEWYLDRASGVLCFWPPEKAANADSPAGSELLVSLLEAPIISLTDVSNVTVRGLTLEAGRGKAVKITGGSNVTIAGCIVRLMGNAGVTIESGRGHKVIGCDIENTGDGGVQLNGGNRQTLEPGEHVVENCHFQKQGRWSKCYVPAVLVNGVGHQVRNNMIHDHPHCAILYGGNEHLIELNEIHRVALETGDVGAIYTGRDWTYRGNRIRHNFIHHTGGLGMGSMGAYMDDCVSGTEIFGNIFYKVTRAAFLGGGRDHRVENNIFVECNPAVQLDGRGLDKSPVWSRMVNEYMLKQLAAVPTELYRQRYPALMDLDKYYASTNGVPPEGNSVLRNVCVGGQWLSMGWHATSAMLEVADNYVGADPGFGSIEKMDFTLRDDSPVWKLGFKAIPASHIGLKEDPYRRSGVTEAALGLRQVKAR
jgi:hypothetical protein